MGHGHSRAHDVEGNEKRLYAALALTMLFTVVEIVGGIVTNSLALLSDAAHMFTDVTALAMASTHILFEETPADMDVAKLRAQIELKPGGARPCTPCMSGHLPPDGMFRLRT